MFGQSKDASVPVGRRLLGSGYRRRTFMNNVTKRDALVRQSIGNECIFNGMRSAGLRAIVLVALSTFLTGLAVAAGPIVTWQRVEGIDPHPNSATAGAIAGIQPVAFPWSVTRGRVRLNTATNVLTFYVAGLSMGGSIGIGTTGPVTAVKGTIVCTTTFVVSDTDSVEMSEDGNVSFSGQLSPAVDCDPSRMIFLLRVAGGIPQIQNFWLASGAVRRNQ